MNQQKYQSFLIGKLYFWHGCWKLYYKHRTMKNLIVLLLAITTSFGFAQKRGMNKVDPEERAQEKIDRLDAELQLSNNQKSELKTYFIEAQKETQQIRKKQVQRRETARENREAMQAQRAEISKVRKNSMETRRAATEEKMKSVLSEDQFSKWKEMKEDRQERVTERQRRGEGKRERRGERKGRERVKGGRR